MTTVSDIVRGQDLAQLASTSTIREAARHMVEHGVGSVLVVENGALRGIFTERDALKVFVATRRNPDFTQLADVMTETPQTLSPDASRARFPVPAQTNRRAGSSAWCRSGI